MTMRIGIVGLGKIARDQHVPAIRASADWVLAAVADPAGGLDGVPSFASLDAMLTGGPPLDAVALCTPPRGRAALAAAALGAGLHVLLEKPPGAAVAEIAPLLALAEARGRTLFASWHSRFAPAVQPAREWLQGRTVQSFEIDWREDVRVWHPGQDWIWQPGGLGVFDPGINALSILTAILPAPVFLRGAELSFPSNRDAPIAATLSFGGVPGRAVFDWRHTGTQTWDIHLDTDAGRLTLSAGGARLRHGAATLLDAAPEEYPALYRHFAQAIAANRRDVDLSPLVHVADAFMLGLRRVVEPFHDRA